MLCETVWVLHSGYQCSREEIMRALKHILETRHFDIERRDAAWAALDDDGQSGADYADCIIGRIARAAGCKETITFDKQAARLPYYRLLGPDLHE